MAALDKSIYEEIIITSADGSKTVDIAMGSLTIDYYEDLFSPVTTVRMIVANDGYTITGEDGNLQSVYNGFPLRGGETVSIKIKGNCESNPGLDFTDRPFFVSSIENVIVTRKTESFLLNLVSIGSITNETSRVGKKFPTSLKISESVQNPMKFVIRVLRK